MHDADQQLQPTSPVILDGPTELGPLLPPDVIGAFAAIKKRRRLLTTQAYRENNHALTALTYGLQHQPTPRRSDSGQRDFVRVASWNIQRGIHLDKIKRYLAAHEDLRHLDILLLNEVDIGMGRSGNRHVAAELASHLGFGYVYGNSYLCLDFGDARDGVPGETEDNRESLHGNAILSRFPFRRAENFTVRITKDKFHSSEKRLGHKKALWAEVDTPLGLLPVVAVHLDAYAAASQRGEQLQDVLDKLDERGLSERVLLGGDLNTSTYNAKTVGQICLNLAAKLARGGFPHAMHHYLHPYELYEKPVFERLEESGFDYRSFNAMAVGTTRYEVGSYDSESKVSDELPQIAVRLLRYKLRPWGGVAPLKVDWFAGRGLQVLQGAGGSHNGEPKHRAPAPVARPTVDGTRLSDHDPILVDVTF